MAEARGHVQAGWRGFVELRDPAELGPEQLGVVAENVELRSRALAPRGGLELVTVMAAAVTGLHAATQGMTEQLVVGLAESVQVASG